MDGSVGVATIVDSSSAAYGHPVTLVADKTPDYKMFTYGPLHDFLTTHRWMHSHIRAQGVFSMLVKLGWRHWGVK